MEATELSPEIPVREVVEDTKLMKEKNGELPPVGKANKKEEEENALEGEFVKVDEESLEPRASATDRLASFVERSLSDSSRELLETREKMRELELEIERLAGMLKLSETENSRLKDEVSFSDHKLEENGKKYEELELNHKKLREQISDTEEKYNLQIKTLHDTLQDQEAKQKELIEVKESFDLLTLELKQSRKRSQELEHELKFYADEALKFEDLHKKNGSLAESEAKRAQEIERLLETAKLSAKEREDQITSLQEEVKGLYDKTVEYQKVEELLSATTAELSAVQEELTLSKQQLSSKEALLNDIIQELDLKKASEAQVKEDVSALENLFASTREELQAKVSELEEVKLKLTEELKTKELVEAELKTHESQVSVVRQELAAVIREKESLEVTVADLTSNLEQIKESCCGLEEKLKLSDENLRNTESLLSQASSNNAELVQKLKSLEELLNESEAAGKSASQKNLELEEIIQISNAAAEELKLQLRELETCFMAAEEKNVGLEDQLNLFLHRSNDAEKELKEFSDKIAELNALLKDSEEGKKTLASQKQEYEDKITHLESELSHSSLMHSDLEKDLKIYSEKCIEHEDRANRNHQRSIELENLVQMSHAKAEDTSKRVSELELLLEAEKYRIQELEEQIAILEKQRMIGEVDVKKTSDKVSELASELEAFQTRASSLESALHVASENERELTESLDLVTEEKKQLENALGTSSQKLAESENLLEVLSNELNLKQSKLENLEGDIKAASIRETELIEKLKHVEEKVEHQGGTIDQIIARKSELESLHESLTKNSEIRLQEALANFTNRDSEAKSLLEKVSLLEEQVNIYKDQVTQADTNYAVLKEELNQNLEKLASLESTNSELTAQIFEWKNKTSQFSSEKEILSETNVQLKSRISELQELLDLALSEKEAAAQQLFSHKSTIEELTEKQSRDIELQSQTEAHRAEADSRLQEAIHRFNQRDSEAGELNEKLKELECEIKLHEEQAQMASQNAEAHKSQVESTLLKLKDLEGIVEEMQTKANYFEKQSAGLLEENAKLTKEVALYESRLSDFQDKLSAAHVDRDETIERLHSSGKAIEDLRQQLTSEGQRLQYQISSMAEENTLLNETYQSAKEELHSVILQLEGQLKEQKENGDSLRSEIEILKAKIAEKSALHTHLKEVEEQLRKSQTQLKEEVESVQTAAAAREAELISKLDEHEKTVNEKDLLNDRVLQLQEELRDAHTTIAEQKEDSREVLEREASLKHSLEELEAKNKTIAHLERQVADLEQKLRLADFKLSETDGGSGGEVKFRDAGSSISSSTRRKHKKSEGTSAEESPSQETLTRKAEVPSFMTFKFVLGVALVSVIVGVILGKRY